MRRRLARLGAWTSGLLVLTAGGVWLVAERVAVGMIVDAPSPELESVAPPPDASPVEVARSGAVIRAWVFEPEGEARGTVLCLHGIRDSKGAHVPTARRFVALDLRAVAVDSRGHGESSGEWLTYGVRESRDLEALADALDARGELTPPLLVVGTSYGAATAIQYGALDPRVEGVVAIAPFASLREIVREYQSLMLGSFASIVPGAWTDAVVDEAGAQADFDPDTACPRCAAARLEAPLLLIHGREDERIPWQHSAVIRDAAAGPAELRIVEGTGHDDVGSAAGVTEAVDTFVLERAAGR